MANNGWETFLSYEDPEQGLYISVACQSLVQSTGIYIIKHMCAIHRKDKGTYMGVSHTKAIYGTRKHTHHNI